MKLNLEGKSALVTGAGRGIGRAICKELVSEGCKVFAVSRSEEYLESLRKETPEIHTFSIDLTKKYAEYDTLQHFGIIPDILINNLGSTLGITDPLCAWSDWNRVWEVDMKSTVEFTRRILPIMQERKWGRIINISSVSGVENNGPVTHCAIKSAMIAYSRCMGRIYAKDGIVISCVLPGPIQSTYWDEKIKEDPKHVERYKQERCPSGEFGKPEDIAGIVAYLCSDRAKYCQGTVIPVDGGLSKNFFRLDY